MKKQLQKFGMLTILLLSLGIVPLQIMAQGFKYQTVCRDADGKVMANTSVSFEVSIIKTSSSGDVVYTERHAGTTNDFGLIHFVIGNGAVQDGNFSTIAWGDDDYFLNVKFDPAGATSFSDMGTSPLMSVPFAMFSENAGSLAGTITASQVSDFATAVAGNAAVAANTAKNSYPIEDATKLAGIEAGAEVNVQADWNQATTTADDYIKNKPTIPAAADGSETKITAGTNVIVTGSGTTASPYVINASGGGERYIGEEYLDGIIFYIYTDNTGTQKGLIVSKTETTAEWQNTGVLVNADRTEDGDYNTGLMTDSPAKTWVTDLGAGWYLPSIDELSLLWHNRYHVNKTARAIGSTLLSTTATYWSSTENDAANAFEFYFDSGDTSNSNKAETFSVRAVRAF